MLQNDQSHGREMLSSMEPLDGVDEDFIAREVFLHFSRIPDTDTPDDSTTISFPLAQMHKE